MYVNGHLNLSRLSGWVWRACFFIPLPFSSSFLLQFLLLFVLLCFSLYLLLWHECPSYLYAWMQKTRIIHSEISFHLLLSSSPVEQTRRVNLRRNALGCCRRLDSRFACFVGWTLIIWKSKTAWENGACIEMVDAASFIGCYYSYGGRLPPSGSWYYNKPCFQSGQRQYPWLGYKQEDTNSTLVHSQLPTLIISHMCHSRYVICTDVIIDRTPEWLNLGIRE